MAASGGGGPGRRGRSLQRPAGWPGRGGGAAAGAAAVLRNRTGGSGQAALGRHVGAAQVDTATDTGCARVLPFKPDHHLQAQAGS